MGTPLTETAPADAAEDPSVEDQSPEVDSEVDDGSGRSETPPGFIPENRFNGLMGRFHQEQERASRAEAQVSELQARIEALEQASRPGNDSTPATQEQSNVTDTNGGDREVIQSLQQQVEMLTGLLLQDHRSKTAETVFQEYPEAKPFEDLIRADDPEEFRQVAADIAQRIRGFAPPAQGGEGGSTDTTPVDSDPPAGAGAVPFEESKPEPSAELQDAIARRDWTAAIAAKAKQVYGDDQDGLVLRES